ncbi:hypothetical protein V6N11_041043 [Hibiscus sabdariffa]|uniref:Uncharacterized protein n=1 Tax=Hibiscus sabdariffa TaxID=183260 RepID=A0ABR2RJ92_9ROSI
MQNSIPVAVIALNPFYRVERICKPDKTLSYPLFPSTPPLNALDVPVLGGQLFLPYPDPRVSTPLSCASTAVSRHHWGESS